MVSFLAGLVTQTQYHWACVAGLHDLLRTVASDFGPPVWGNALCLFAVKTAMHVPCAAIELMSAWMGLEQSIAPQPLDYVYLCFLPLVVDSCAVPAGKHAWKGSLPTPKPIQNRRRRWLKQRQEKEEMVQKAKADLDAQERAHVAATTSALSTSTSMVAGATSAAASAEAAPLAAMGITSSLPMLGGQLLPWGGSSSAGSSLQALSTRMQSVFGISGASTLPVVKIEHSAASGAMTAPPPPPRSHASSDQAGFSQGSWLTQQSKPDEAQHHAMETFRSWHAWGTSVLDNAAASLAAFVDPPDQQALAEGASPGQAGGSTGGDARFYIIAWDGPRKGQCNADTVSLKELGNLASLGHIPTDALVWTEDEGMVDGDVHWQPLWKVLRMRKDDGDYGFTW